MSANKAKNTKPELILRKALWNMGIKGYRLHWKNIPGRPDIVFPKNKIAIFVNGCFWHRCPYCQPNFPKSNVDFWKKKFDANISRDALKLQLLAAQSWKVITIWECQIKEDIDKSVLSIKNLIDETISKSTKGNSRP